MTPITAAVSGTGRYLPETRLSNTDLYARASIRENFDLERARTSLRDVERPEALAPEEVFDRWAVQVTGIESRRILSPESELTTEDMCAEAGRAAIEAAGLHGSDVDLMYVATLTAADIVPNPQCTVADRMGIPHVGGYTLNAACAGFVHALASGWAAIRAELAETVLVISGDALTRVVDYADVKTAVVFGDGAGAAVLTRSTDGLGIRGRPVIGGSYDRAPLYLVAQGWETRDEPTPRIHMEGGPQILRNAINTMGDAGRAALETAGLEWRDVDFVIPHQANLRITRGLERSLGLEHGRVIHNIQNYGNMSASTVPVTFDEVVRGMHGRVPDPATFVLTSIGGGYTTAAVVLDLHPAADQGTSGIS